jgi:hypothetical protein
MTPFELSNSEMDTRLANLVTPYGQGSRSYNRSAEKRESKTQQAAVTAKYEAGPKQEYMIMRCNCRSFRLPHDLSAHQSLKHDGDWTPWEERYVFNTQTNSYELRVQRFREPVR